MRRTARGGGTAEKVTSSVWRALTTLLLVRHGQTDWNRTHRWQGHTGAPLNDKGRRQAEELAQQIDSRIDAVYSSDSERAYETALILAQRRNLQVQVDPRLRELDFGEWEGLTRAQINERFNGAFAKWLSGENSTPNGGEADETMAERVMAALEDISRQHPHGRVLVVTSGGPIRAVEARLQGIDQTAAKEAIKGVANCSLVELVIRDGVWGRPSAVIANPS